MISSQNNNVLGIVGYRGYTDYANFCNMIFYLDQQYQLLTGIDTIASGGAPGADTLAERFCAEYGYKPLIFRPNYNEYNKFVAPLMRNTQIVDVSFKMVAFKSKQSRGTLDTIKKMLKTNRELYVIDI